MRSLLDRFCALIVSVLFTALMTAPIWFSHAIADGSPVRRPQHDPFTAPQHLGMPMAYLTRNGAVRLALDEAAIADLKRQGWRLLPLPQGHPTHPINRAAIAQPPLNHRKP
jgi:hypothetical protein